jgi:hypothetical protein
MRRILVEQVGWQVAEQPRKERDEDQAEQARSQQHDRGPPARSAVDLDGRGRDRKVPLRWFVELEDDPGNRRPMGVGRAPRRLLLPVAHLSGDRRERRPELAKRGELDQVGVASPMAQRHLHPDDRTGTGDTGELG